MLGAAAILASCASANLKKASPAEFGWGVQATPGIQIKDGPYSAHAVLAYSRLGFDGGHDNVYQFGAQLRKTLDESSPNGLWVGGEVSYLKFKSIYDSDTFFEGDPKANGFTVGGLVGYRTEVQGIPISPFASVSLVSFGDFESGGTIIDSSGAGVMAKIGLCVHVASLIHDKGR